MGEKDRVNKVIFFKDENKLSDALKEFGIKDFKDKEVLIKLHMGEKKNKYYPRPPFVKKVVDELLNVSSKPFLYDTTVLYNSQRRYKEGYEKIADFHGFSKEKIGCNVIIDDEGTSVEIEKHTYNVGKIMNETKNIIALSHVKGHIASGMGGTIKNFGMGGVTRETKKWMHDSCKPEFQIGNCQYCGKCAEVCPFKAIKVEEDKWKINENSCFGCGVCIENCEYDAIKFVDNDLSYFLACSTKACVQNKNVIYINDVNRISRSCDCDPNSGPIICPDVGYLVSDDPVTIDKASIDLINEIKSDVFLKENKVDPYKQIRFGEEIGLGTQSYELINI
jgi:uncharacterized Fe-S center protein